jgi:general secretion pathway protein D
MERYSSSCPILRPRFVSILGLLCLLALGNASMAQTPCSIEGAGYRSITLNRISPQLAKRMVDPLKLAAVSQLPSTDMVLVTGEPEQVAKMATILEVIDSAEPYEIRELRSGSSPKSLPANAQIAAAVGGIVIGTFTNPPKYTSKAKVLIDVCNGSIWTVAPVLRVAEIVTAVDVGPDVLARQKETSSRITDGAMLGRVLSPNPGDHRAAPAVNVGERTQPAVSMTMNTSPSLMTQTESAVLSEAVSRPPAARPRTDSNTPAASAPASAPTSVSVTPQTPDVNTNEARRLQPGQPVPGASPDTTNARAETPSLPPARMSDATLIETMRAPRMSNGKIAESPMTPADLADPNRLVHVSLPEKLPVIQLLDLIGKYMNLTYIYNPDEVKGEITLKLDGGFQGDVPVKKLYYLLESILRFQGLAMTRHNGNIVTIVKVENAASIDPLIVGVNDAARLPGDAVVVCVFKLEHIDTTSAKNLLEGMRVPMDVKTLEETSTIIVTAYAFRMDRIKQLLSIVDRPGEQRKYQCRQLRYTTAKALSEKVKNLAEQLQPGSVTVGDPDPVVSTVRNPGESDQAYQQRLAQARQLAAVRQQQALQTPKPAGRENKAGAYLDADEHTNRILMIGTAKQLEMVDELIQSLDVEQQDLRSFKPYQMKHVDAQDVAKKLQELGVISKTPESPTSQRITTPTNTARAGQPLTAEEARIRALQLQQEQTRIAQGLPASTSNDTAQQGPIEEPQVVVIEATNSLLVNATVEQHAQIAKIIGFLDNEIEDRPYKIYPIENSSAEHLAEILQSLIQDTVQNRDKDGKIVETTTVKKIQDEVTIKADPNTNSIIVVAPKKHQDWMLSMIKQLDKRRPQVLIDVTLVEITNSKSFDYDLNIIESLPDLTNQSGLMGTLTGSGTSAVGSSTIMSNLANSGKDHYADMQSSGGKFQGFYGDKHINFLLTAMETNSSGRVLAKPKILINDNETGKIKTADVTYVEKSTAIPTSTGSGNNGTLVTTATDYAQYEAGIELNVVPHISDGDLLQLKAVLTRSDFLPTSDATKPPNKTESQVESNVTVPDGSTIILGGMLKLNQTKSGSKVPLLGDLPLVGGLFRTISNSNNESKLYVFVKAQIIRPATLAKSLDDLKQVSIRNREAFEGYEKEFQDYQSWPGLKSEPISPAKVLDAQ